jgi:transposase
VRFLHESVTFSSKHSSSQRLALSAKKEVIAEVNSGKSMAKVALEFGISKSTVHGIVMQKGAIEEAVDQGVGSKRKNLKNSNYADLDKSLLEWLKQARSLNLPVSGPLLQVIS